MTDGLSLPGGITTSRGWLPEFLNGSLSEISAAMASGRFWPNVPIDEPRLNGRCHSIAATRGVNFTGSEGRQRPVANPD
jgi:hypothetical protein